MKLTYIIFRVLAGILTATAAVSGIDLTAANVRVVSSGTDVSASSSTDLFSIFSRSDSSRDDGNICSPTCMRRILYQVTFSSAAAGVGEVMDTFGATNWCAAPGNDEWCQDFVNTTVSALTRRVMQNITLPATGCDASCLLQSVADASRLSGHDSMVWALQNFNQTLDGSAPSAAAMKNVTDAVYMLEMQKPVTDGQVLERGMAAAASTTSTSSNQAGNDGNKNNKGVLIGTLTPVGVLSSLFAGSVMCKDPVICPWRNSAKLGQFFSAVKDNAAIKDSAWLRWMFKGASSEAAGGVKFLETATELAGTSSSYPEWDPERMAEWSPESITESVESALSKVEPTPGSLWRGELWDPKTETLVQQTLRYAPDLESHVGETGYNGKKALKEFAKMKKAGNLKPFRMLDAEGNAMQKGAGKHLKAGDRIVWHSIDAVEPLNGVWKRVGAQERLVVDGVTALDSLGMPFVRAPGTVSLLSAQPLRQPLGIPANAAEGAAARFMLSNANGVRSATFGGLTQSLEYGLTDAPADLWKSEGQNDLAEYLARFAPSPDGGVPAAALPSFEDLPPGSPPVSPPVSPPESPPMSPPGSPSVAPAPPLPPVTALPATALLPPAMPTPNAPILPPAAIPPPVVPPPVVAPPDVIPQPVAPMPVAAPPVVAPPAVVPVPVPGGSSGGLPSLPLPGIPSIPGFGSDDDDDDCEAETVTKTETETRTETQTETQTVTKTATQIVTERAKPAKTVTFMVPSKPKLTTLTTFLKTTSRTSSLSTHTTTVLLTSTLSVTIQPTPTPTPKKQKVKWELDMDEDDDDITWKLKVKIDGKDFIKVEVETEERGKPTVKAWLEDYRTMCTPHWEYNMFEAPESFDVNCTPEGFVVWRERNPCPVHPRKNDD